MGQRLSSRGQNQIPKRIILPALALAWAAAAPLSAQDETERADGSVEIDVLATIDDLYGPAPPMEDCSEEQEAAILSGEIIVCRRKQDQRQYRTVPREEAQRRYAEETAFKSDPKTPDFILDCHDQGWPVGCVKFGGVPPKALIIDVTALPQAPPGSDADRISRGLPPLGDSNPVQPAPARPDDEIDESELGLPDVD